MPRKIRKGSLITNGVVLEVHETATIVLFLELGYDVELIPRSNQEGIFTLKTNKKNKNSNKKGELLELNK